MERVRICIIGVGAIAIHGHLPSYAKREDVDVVAFVDPERDRVTNYAQRFGREYNRPVPAVYANLDDMLQHEQIDAVSICTPNTTHVDLAVLALQAGLHVLLEKPMSTSLEAALQLEQVAQQQGKTLLVGMPNRYRDDVTVLKRYVDAGDLGDIYYAKTRILRRRGTPKGWFTNQELSGGGPLMDIGVHALDLTWWLMGTPNVQSASGFLHQGIGNDALDYIETWASLSSANANNEIYTTEDFAAAMLRFSNGSVLQLEVSWALNGPEDDALKVEIFGSKGGLSLDPLRFYGTQHGVLTNSTPKVGVGPMFDQEINHFLHCVTTGATPLSDVVQGREIVRMLEMITHSAQQGKEITR